MLNDTQIDQKRRGKLSKITKIKKKNIILPGLSHLCSQDEAWTSGAATASSVQESLLRQEETGSPFRLLAGSGMAMVNMRSIPLLHHDASFNNLFHK